MIPNNTIFNLWNCFNKSWNFRVRTSLKELSHWVMVLVGTVSLAPSCLLPWFYSTMKWTAVLCHMPPPLFSWRILKNHEPKQLLPPLYSLFWLFDIISWILHHFSILLHYNLTIRRDLTHLQSGSSWRRKVTTLTCPGRHLSCGDSGFKLIPGTQQLCVTDLLTSLVFPALW